MDVNTLPHDGISIFFTALFIGNTCCEKDFEAVKSDTQDFRKARIRVSPSIYIWSLVRMHQEARSNSHFLLNHLYRAHKRCHLHVELIFLVPFIQGGDRLGA